MASCGADEAVESQDSELVGDEGEQKLAQMSVSLFLAMADSCRLKNNFTVTLKIMKNTKDVSLNNVFISIETSSMQMYSASI